jgi:hypothetical protein
MANPRKDKQDMEMLAEAVAGDERELHEIVEGEKKIAEGTRKTAEALSALEQAPDKEQKRALRELDLLADSLHGPGDFDNPLEDYNYSRPVPSPHYRPKTITKKG